VHETRGQRGAYLRHGACTILPGQTLTWWIAADLNQSGAKVATTLNRLQQPHNLSTEIEASIRADTDQIYDMVARADGSQSSGRSRQDARHFSNTLFNLMRGGTFPMGYTLSTADLLQHIRLCNAQSYERHRSRLEALPPDIELTALRQTLSAFAGPELTRIAEEYLPLTFSRRHGDPSRPWNRFSIDIVDDADQPIYAYQGNWRDIFQNWETLLHSYPLFSDAIISRFLNASTADGYNPYRITKTGFEWEHEEPGAPWSNIGYWGDHQIIYLLKLLEFSRKTQPEQLVSLLNQSRYAFADVPYRIKAFEDILHNARDTIVYDHQHAAHVAERVQLKGTDGQLLHDSDGNILHATLFEKLIVPLLSKLSNFVPAAGIWMNTQRPEWNDANNALAGYGASVVTLGYLHRYLVFLLELIEACHTEAFDVHAPVAELFASITHTLGHMHTTALTNDTERGSIVHALGQAGSHYRGHCYDGTFGNRTVHINRHQALEALQHFRNVVAQSLQANRRADSLYHAYNLLHFPQSGIVRVEHLSLMLEGQVSILSSGILSLDQALQLVQSLRASELFRADQESYLLYPNRELPTFLEKGVIPTSAIEAQPELESFFGSANGRITQTDSNGTIRFNPNLRNAAILEKTLLDMATEPALTQKVLNLYETTFHHHAFTGRSGTFFAYEGLGSIYWHMVSKLVLAVQEILIAHREPSPERNALLQAYFEIRRGIGVEKSPAAYGAFPTDAYSHTPAHAGVQQPGMTGQVKEDILVRLGELGLRLHEGTLSFEPSLLQMSDFTQEPTPSLSFTCCNTPVCYQLQIADTHISLPCTTIEYPDGTSACLQALRSMWRPPGRFSPAPEPCGGSQSIFPQAGSADPICPITRKPI
jgi:hypothetical protein